MLIFQADADKDQLTVETLIKKREVGYYKCDIFINFEVIFQPNLQ